MATMKLRLEELSLVYATEALTRVVEVMRNSESDATALRAAEGILKYAFPAGSDSAPDDIATMNPRDRILALQEALTAEMEDIQMSEARHGH